jgi:GNAT superfamily N-acetyltransferase
VHSLLTMMIEAAEGRFPPVDGLVEVVPRFSGALHEYVLEFTGHAVVMTDLSPLKVNALRADGFGGAVHPDVLRALAGPAGHIGCHDALLVKRGIGSGSLAVRKDLDDHSRVQHARTLRRDVVVYGDDDRGLVCLGRGIADRREISIEVAPGGRNLGYAKQLLAQAIAMVPEGEWCFAEVSPGNAASLRAFLAAGWTPIGAEVIFVPSR